MDTRKFLNCVMSPLSTCSEELSAYEDIINTKKYGNNFGWQCPPFTLLTVWHFTFFSATD